MSRSTISTFQLFVLYPDDVPWRALFALGSKRYATDRLERLRRRNRRVQHERPTALCCAPRAGFRD